MGADETADEKNPGKPGFFRFRVPNNLDRLDVGRLLALRASGHVKRDFLVFG